MLYNIIVTYNRADMLGRVLNNLAEGGFHNIILVDNNSNDHTTSVIDKFRPKIQGLHVISLKENTGGAGGFSEGVKAFLSISTNDDDFALLHDDDSWPNFDIDRINEYLDGKNVKMGCFPVVYPSGDLVRMNIPGNANFLKAPWLFFDYVSGGRRPKNLDEFNYRDGFDYCGFVGFLIRKDVIEDVGVPSKEFFIYSDDTSYTFLASERVGKITNLFAGNFTFSHDCKRSTGRSLLKSRFSFYEVRNKIIFFRMCSKFHVLFSLFFLIKSLIVAPDAIMNIFSGALHGYLADKSIYYPTSLS